MTVRAELPLRLSHRAYTLIELMIVITVIAMALSLLASHSSKPEFSRRLTTGAQLFSAKLREARGVAAMRQSTARLLVHTDPSQPELMLKSIIIVAETEIGSNQWEPVGDAEKLPQGVCWVPVGGGYGWTGPLSSGGKDVTFADAAGAWNPGTACWAYEFSATGRISSAHYDAYLGQGATEGGDAVFYNPKNFRGLRVTSYGQVSGIADAALPK